ncbi:MAG: hypothetical protein GC189_07595 [Alphaproteobacteria bacterium]|nr:hypothetical protein [Alphaproteobacteria bacterium]
MTSQHWRASRKTWIADLVFGALAAVAVFAVGLMYFVASDARDLDRSALLIVVGATIALTQWRGGMAWLMRRIRASVGRYLNARAQAKGPHALARVIVVDGDTLDDATTGARYRVANIDAPETGNRAGCEMERAMGERAKAYASAVLTKARVVTAHPTGELDKYGRVLAFVVVDNKDLGSILIERGFARAWNGKRGRWCGKAGGLRQLAHRRAEPWSCPRAHASTTGTGETNQRG